MSGLRAIREIHRGPPGMPELPASSSDTDPEYEALEEAREAERAAAEERATAAERAAAAGAGPSSYGDVDIEQPLQRV